MKMLMARRFSKAMNGVFIACLAFAANGATNVFDDAVFWFRGGKDKNSDTYMQKGEFFDDLHADNNNHDNHKMSMSSEYYTGQLDVFKDNAVLHEESVVFPASGTSMAKNMQVLRISSLLALEKYYFPFDVKPRSIFANNNISNEYTVVSRIRLDDDTYNRNECFLKLGYDDSTSRGMWFGFTKQSSSSHAGCRRIMGHCTPNVNGNDSEFMLNLHIPTNTWVDVAVVVGNGRLRVGIATPASLASHGNNSTIAFDETPMWTDNCPLLGDSNYRMFCKEGQTTYKTANNTDQTCFIGSVQQLAIWGRALSDQEVMEAFGMPRPSLFRMGFDNGASTEFGGTRTGSMQTIDGLGSWQGIWNEMRPNDEWTVNFNALRDEANLAQIFSIKSLRGSAAQIEVALNGTPLGEGRVAATSRAFWPVTANLVHEGLNTLVIKCKDSGPRGFLIDAMELGGSLGVGSASNAVNDGRVAPDKIATGVPSAADPNPAHWPVGFQPYVNNNTNLHFRVWADPEVVGVCTSRFWTCAQCKKRSGYNPTGNEVFRIFVNGVEKTSLSANSNWKDIEVGFDPGVLRGGWNDFEIRSDEAYQTCYWYLDRYRFETVLPSLFGFSTPPGLAVSIR